MIKKTGIPARDIPQFFCYTITHLYLCLMSMIVNARAFSICAHKKLRRYAHLTTLTVFYHCLKHVIFMIVL